jgi:hypothetical protein
MAVKKFNKIKKPFAKVKQRYDSFLKRRPHRSFRQTRRRDYVRSLKLPGYIAFTNYVTKTIWTNRKTFGFLGILYALMTLLLVGVASQDLFSTMANTINTTSGDLFASGFGQIGKAGLLFVTAATGGLSQPLTESQQIYAGIITLLTWMTSVWLLRNIMAGHKVKLRDGLYSAGSPIVSTFIVALVFIIQLLPLALAFIGYAAASATGLLDSGVEAMLFWIAAGLLAVLSIYWSTSTFFALVIVTLPGMYPYRALKTAGDIVVGRRLRILLRLIWMVLIVILTWAIIMIPIIMLDVWIKSFWTAIAWVPTIPIMLLVLGAFTIIWISSYIYLLYRKVVADDAQPA